MELIDYTGKLNDHNEYIKMLEALESITKTIRMVVLDFRIENDFTTKFSNYIIKKEKIKGSFLTKSPVKNILYSFNANKEMFDYLKTFETFCKFYRYGENEISKKYGDYSERTSFGIDDIAFYDENDNVLLVTCTHEGEIGVDKKLPMLIK